MAEDETVNPFSTLPWFWRAIRTRSLTFSAAFALGLFGLSVIGGFRHVLRAIGTPWYVWLLLPFAIVTILSRQEASWMPDPAERQKWARRIVVGSILLVLLAAKLAPKPAVEPMPARVDRSGMPGR